MGEESSYIVRGASMWCTSGSHHRKINLPLSHGVYVNGQPMMNQADCSSVDNIPFFGTCKSGSNPNNETIYLIGEQGQPESGKRCCPKFYGQWELTKSDARVEEKGALITDSQLICAYGGCITFKDNGQNGE
ncbi:DUF4280 domain-containing protein [Paenibacillus sp. SYP-B3998]|uniref:DUF4280 domain-containing protein n=1 Tax=Paenibacillus sp. SYP-B3998 TaxID=2678564 RepID=A0A6G4A7K8_9BACL|nr:DUF4280 domain-containing protein [Paenibacillus sp. SYP-B3998]NEW09789.1 DUF4280 domain-containing protein [Paenibacillus sp. SYP-B3998]